MLVAALSEESVHIVSYDPRWPELFELERACLQAVAGEWVEAIEHVGSTAVPGLDAKPVVDVVAGVRSLREVDRFVHRLAGIGYESRGEAGVAGRLFFRKLQDGRRVFHLHVTGTDHAFWENHLLFRDYLRAHPGTAGEYARLKHELAVRFRDDRESYTRAKTEFIERVVARARAARGRAL